MKELLTQYANYNIWANSKMVDLVLKLTQEQLDTDIESSFNTIRKTVYHGWGAEFVWLQRMQLVENWKYTGNDLHIPVDEVCSQWLQTSNELKMFIEKQYDDKAFEHVFQYYDSKKIPHKHPVGQTLMHVFNHATYHRGQLVTMLRQVGVSQLPATDFYIWAKKG